VAKRKTKKSATGGSSDDSDVVQTFNRQFSIRTLLGALHSIGTLLDIEGGSELREKLEEWGEVVESPDRLLLGYKLGILVPVYSLLSEAFTSPETFGVEAVEGIGMAFTWNQEGFLIPSGNSEHEKLIRNVWWIRTELISAGSWEQLQAAAERVTPYLKSMSGLLESHYVVRLSEPAKELSLKDFAPTATIDFVHVTFHDERTVEWAYSELFRSGSEFGGTTTRHRLRASRRGRNDPGDVTRTVSAPDTHDA